MLLLTLSLISLLLISNVPIYNGEENETTLDYINENAVITLDDVGALEIETLLNDYEHIEYRDIEGQLDYNADEVTDSKKTVAVNKTQRNNFGEKYKEKLLDNTGPDTDTENLLNSNKTAANEKMQGNILGGEYANILDFPHSVFLMAYCNANDNTDFWMCGGSVLNQRIVLTAAHCVYGCIGRFKIDVLAGSSNYEKAKVLKQVKRIAYHSKYRDEGVYADIGLVFLNGNLPLSKEIRRVLIRPEFPGFVEGRMAGWGIIDERGTITTKLKSVKQKVWSNCHKYEKLELGTFCASSGSNKNYALSGDSGSALVVPNFQQLGLVSYREERYPELIVYTNVSYYYKWIRDMSKKIVCG